MTPSQITAFFDLNREEAIEAMNARVMAIAMDRGCDRHYHSWWTTTSADLPTEVPRSREIVWSYVSSTTIQYIRCIPNNGSPMVVAISVHPGQSSMSFTVVGQSADQVQETIDRYKTEYPEKVVTVTTVPWDFWTAGGSQGTRSIKKDLDRSPWEGIRDNYTQTVQHELDAVMAMTGSSISSSRLILWHGSPGTGKTHAVLSLATMWSEWCDFGYIVDPARFLVGDSSYLLDVIAPSMVTRGSRRAPRWKCLVFEDTGEVIGEDAKIQSGQGLSRLLNVSDGILGQGSRSIILITTNEPIDRIHPAIKRPGRCLCDLTFSPLTKSEANAWADRHGTPRPDRDATIAELYNMGSQISNAAPRPAIGFVPANRP